MKHAHVHQAHVIDFLRALPDESVHCVITSPPYWGLRDYGLPPTVWGSDPECEHEWGDERVVSVHTNYNQDFNDRWGQGSGQRKQEDAKPKEINQGAWCQLCGAWRGCLGLEPTPELHVENIVSVFREVRRVLRKDGTVWLNYGDCYAQGKGSINTDENIEKAKRRAKGYRGNTFGSSVARMGRAANTAVSGLKPKDRVMMPARVALALQADGWWLRSEIVWHKPNPMPSSVRDRPTDAHEMIYLLAKSARYFYDGDAIREGGRNWGTRNRTSGKHHQRAYANGQPPQAGLEGCPAGRNRRTVWTIPTQPFPEAHFATFPEALVEPCILAGTSAAGACPECGSPWRRVVEATGGTIGQSWHDHKDDGLVGQRVEDPRHKDGSYHRETKRWEPACGCDPPTIVPGVPCVVLDPFAGSGTVGIVALRNDRAFVGCELSAEYARMANEYLEATRTGVAVKEARRGQGSLF